MTVNRFLLYVALGALALYSGLSYYPGVLFSESRAYKGVKLYSRTQQNEITDKLLVRVYDAVAADEFFDAAQEFEIYLTGGYREYRLLAPFCGGYSCLHPITGKIFIASSDLDKDQAYGPGGPGTAPRVLENVMTHEAVRAQLKRKFGPIKYYGLAAWKKEGYAEHVAGETADRNPSEACAGGEKGDTLRRYLEYRLVLEELRTEAETTYLSLMTDNFSYESARKKMEIRHCAGTLH